MWLHIDNHFTRADFNINDKFANQSAAACGRGRLGTHGRSLHAFTWQCCGQVVRSNIVCSSSSFHCRPCPNFQLLILRVRWHCTFQFSNFGASLFIGFANFLFRNAERLVPRKFANFSSPSSVCVFVCVLFDFCPGFVKLYEAFCISHGMCEFQLDWITFGHFRVVPDFRIRPKWSSGCCRSLPFSPFYFPKVRHFTKYHI